MIGHCLWTSGSEFRGVQPVYLGLHVIPESYITCNYAFLVTRQSIVKCTPFLSVSEQNYPAFDEIYIERKWRITNAKKMMNNGQNFFTSRYTTVELATMFVAWLD